MPGSRVCTPIWLATSATAASSSRRYGYYWTFIGSAILAFALLWVGVVILGNSWFQLVLAGLLGVLMTQFGFLGHDAAHRQIFRSRPGTTGPRASSAASSRA